MSSSNQHRPSVSSQNRTASPSQIAPLLAPALIVIVFLFGGGLLLGFLQVLGIQPVQGESSFTLAHIQGVVQDPDFAKSLLLTFYISATSTLIAATISVLLALALVHWAAENRLFNFVLQIPLTVPHLVTAIAIIFLLSPSGLLSRLCSSIGLIPGPAAFPLLINDRWSFGIMLVYVWKEVPFITFMLVAVLKNIGPDLMEVGATLNASKIQRFFHITLPILGPGLGGACLIVFAFTFGAFEVPFLLGRTYPMSLPVWAYKNYSDIDLLTRPEGIAIALFIALTVVCAVVFSQLLLHLGQKRGREL
ncbi:MAG: ABC transporter permease [Desulforhopalus sp.]